MKRETMLPFFVHVFITRFPILDLSIRYLLFMLWFLALGVLAIFGIQYVEKIS